MLAHCQRAYFGPADEIRKKLVFLGVSAVAKDLVYAKI